jgi:hypothetical protein
MGPRDIPEPIIVLLPNVPRADMARPRYVDTGICGDETDVFHLYCGESRVTREHYWLWILGAKALSLLQWREDAAPNSHRVRTRRTLGPTVRVAHQTIVPI